MSDIRYARSYLVGTTIAGGQLSDYPIMTPRLDRDFGPQRTMESVVTSRQASAYYVLCCIRNIATPSHMVTLVVIKLDNRYSYASSRSALTAMNSLP